jgi:molybdenum cofactor guanylyltransferase
MLRGASGREGTAGYVLAGGQSSRMGVNKALLPWKGTTLLDYVAGEVEAAAGSVAIVGGGVVSRFRFVPDDFAGAGPMAGISAALQDTSAELNLIVACDMPGVTCAWLQRLLRAAQADVTVPVTPDGRIP